MTPDEPSTELIDWTRIGHRIRRSAIVALSVIVVGSLATAVTRGSWREASIGGWIFVGAVIMIATEFVVVGGSALRGMLRAGERGERLAHPDVTLVPPQARRRKRS